MAGVTRVEAKESAAELEQLLKAQTNSKCKERLQVPVWEEAQRGQVGMKGEQRVPSPYCLRLFSV